MRRKNSSTDAYHSFSSRQQQMRHDEHLGQCAWARGAVRYYVRCLLRYYQLITSVACVCNNYGVTSHGVSWLSVGKLNRRAAQCRQQYGSLSQPPLQRVSCDRSEEPLEKPPFNEGSFQVVKLLLLSRTTFSLLLVCCQKEMGFPRI